MKKIVFITVFALLLPFSGAFAQTNSDCPPGTSVSGRDVKCLANPLGKVVNGKTVAVTSVPQLIGIIIKGLLGVLGSLALLMMVWGGFQWLVSAGNAEKVEAGTKTMLWAAVGVVLALSSYILVNALTDFLTSKP